MKLNHSSLQKYRAPLTAIAAGFLTAALFIMFKADSPGAALKAFFAGPFSSKWYAGSMLNTASLLLLAATGAFLSNEAGELNLGGEGQVYAGGFITALFLNEACSAATASPLLTAVAVTAAALLAATAGAMLTWLPAKLRKFRGIPVLLSTFLLSGAVIPCIDWAVASPFKDPASNLLSTKQIDAAFRFPKLMPPSAWNCTTFIVLAVFCVVFFVLFRTRTGQIYRICGKAPEFARYSGFRLSRNKTAGLLLSGALHGLTGFIAVTGTYYACRNGFYSGLGWNALTIALIAQSAPEMLLPAALVFAYLSTASDKAVLTGTLSGDVTGILQAVVLLTITAQFMVKVRLPGRRPS